MGKYYYVKSKNITYTSLLHEIIHFVAPEKKEITICSLCETYEIESGLKDWREKFGPDVVFFALDCPAWTLKGSDLLDGGKAAIEEAERRLNAALNRAVAGEEVPELEALEEDLDIAPIKYVIWHPDKGDYLAEVKTSMKDGNEYEETMWTQWPGDAINYDTPVDAENKAAALVERHRYTLCVCALHETETQFRNVPLKDISPPNPSFN